jgi:glycosyltransferase involved in cell wall biosynthesis
MPSSTLQDESRNTFAAYMRQQFKVVHLTSVHAAFDVRVFHKECKALARSGKHVVLVAPHEGDEVVDSVEVKGIKICGGRFARMTRTAWSLFREALRQNGEVYHFHDPELIPVGLLLAARGKIVVYDIHEDAPADMLHKDYIPRRLRRPLMWSVRKLEDAACRRFSGLIAATPTIAERFYPINANTVVVHNYPKLDEIAPTVNVPWNERPPAVAYIGSISERRGVREILRALAVLPSTSPAEMMLAGPFSPNGLPTELEALPGWARVRYVGVLGRPAIANLLSRVRLGLLVLQPEPNFVNAMPIKLFEYMAAGIPVIASAFPLWRQIIGEAGCGLLVDPQDPQAIARAIEYLLSHDDEAEAMGHRGRKVACELYNWNSEERILLQFYSDLLKTRLLATDESEKVRQVATGPQHQCQGQVRRVAPYS